MSESGNAISAETSTASTVRLKRALKLWDLIIIGIVIIQPINPHGSNGLDDDNAYDNEVPELEGALQSNGRRGGSFSGNGIAGFAHSRMTALTRWRGWSTSQPLIVAKW